MSESPRNRRPHIVRLVSLPFMLVVAVLLALLNQADSQSAPAQVLFTPTLTVTVDEVAPSDVSILPVDDDCPVGALCKAWSRIVIPNGQPNASIVGLAPPVLLDVVSDAQVPDGAVVGRGFGTARAGYPGSCAFASIPVSWNHLVLDATTDPLTTTGDPNDLISYSNWPSQLDGIRDAFLAANPGAVLRSRTVTRGEPVASVVSSLIFELSDGSRKSVAVQGNPLGPPPTFELCGPIDTNGIALGITADNPDTAQDEGGIPLIVCVTAGVHTITAFLDRLDTPPGDAIPVSDTGSCSSNTPAAVDVSVPLNGGTSVVAGLSVTFPQTTSAGTTSVVTTTTGPAPPTGFNIVGLAGIPLYFDINTTATFTGNVTVCIKYDETQVTGSESLLQLQRYDGASFQPLPSAVDAVNNIVCATAPSLSIWAVMLPPPPTPTPPPGPPAVGGIVELAAGSVGPAAVGDGSFGAAENLVAAVAGGSAAIALAAGGWYARRRFIR